MARPTLSDHRKFRKLATALGSDAMARGCLEFLWESAYQSGDEYLGDSIDVEAAARWRGEPGVLTTALVNAGGAESKGFIVEVAGRFGRYAVHDLWDHAPDYVRRRRQRELERKEKAQRLKSVAPTELPLIRSIDLPVKDPPLTGHRPVNGQHSHSHTHTQETESVPPGSRLRDSTARASPVHAPPPAPAGTDFLPLFETATESPPSPYVATYRELARCEGEVKAIVEQLRTRGQEALWQRVQREVGLLGLNARTRRPALSCPADLARQLIRWHELQGLDRRVRTLRMILVPASEKGVGAG